jgi:hypothetical protein
VWYGVTVRTGPPWNLDNSAPTMTHRTWEFILKCMHREIKMFRRDYDRQARLRTEDAHVSSHPAARLLLSSVDLVAHLYVASVVFQTLYWLRIYVASFRIPSNSSFINNPTIRRYVVWVTDVIK